MTAAAIGVMAALLGAPELERATVPPSPVDGSGRIAAGSGLLVFGAGFIGVGIVSALALGPVAGGIEIGLGTAAGIGGGVLVGRGARARKELRKWEHQVSMKARPSGKGLLALGTMLVAPGAVTLVVAASEASSDLGTPQIVAMSIGGAAVLGGSVALVFGIRRERAYERWRSGPPFVLPTATAGPSGATLGVHVAF